MQFQMARSVLEAMQIGENRGVFDLSDFLLSDELVEGHALPAHSGASKSGGTDEFSDTFLENGWSWPLQDSARVEEGGKYLFSLPQRSKELAYTFHKLHPMPDGVQVLG